jgi:P27 family predicted phage terminase small subunit
MAVTGRKPKSHVQKVAEGNLGRRPLVPGLEVPAGTFRPPLTLGDVGLREWNRILRCAYWLRETEATAIADRCLCFERMVECEEDVANRGTVVRTRNGKVANPSIRIGKSYRMALQRYDVELGLTSASRTRMGAAPSDPNKPLDPLEAALCGALPS